MTLTRADTQVRPYQSKSGHTGPPLQIKRRTHRSAPTKALRLQRRQLLLQHRRRTPSRVVSYAAVWIVDVAVARAHGEVRLVRLPPNLSPLAGLRLAFRIITERVLPAQLVCNVAEGIREILHRVRTIASSSGPLRQILKITVRYFVFAPARAAADAATTAPAARMATAKHAAEYLTQNVCVGAGPASRSGPA